MAPRRNEDTDNYFWSRLSLPDQNGCRKWLKGLYTDGYGQAWFNGKGIRAHRLAWELTFGPIPKGKLVLHNCPGKDNPTCCNPDHLWLGTNEENMEDARRKGQFVTGERHGRYTKPERTARGERHASRTKPESKCKLSQDQVLEILKRRESGETQRRVAKYYGVSQSHIARIENGKHWAWLTGRISK